MIKAINIIKRISSIIAIATLTIAIVMPNAVSASAKDAFWIEYIDVGQGDAALVQCDGHYMLIDGGPSDASSIVYTVLKDKGIKSIDYMVATHPDADHIGGLAGALNYSSVLKCYSSVENHDTKSFSSLIKYLRKHGISLTIPHAGDRFSLGSADVEIVGPISENAETNNNSIVIRITYGSNSFVFMGDAEFEEESELIASGVDLKSDVIKIGHHGSDNSTSTELLENVDPQYAIISVGKKNSYGHPTDEVLSKLYKSGIEVFRTDLQGDIVCSSDGKNITFITEKNIENAILKSSSVPDSVSSIYVLNTNTKKFHDPSCASVDDIKDKNRKDVTLSREEIMVQGYNPCKRCNP